MALDVKFVHLGADTAHGPQSTVREPGTVLGVREIRIAGGKVPASLNEKRRDPHRVIAIERPGKADELTKSIPSLNSCNPECMIGPVVLCGRRLDKLLHDKNRSPSRAAVRKP